MNMISRIKPIKRACLLILTGLILLIIVNNRLHAQVSRSVYFLEHLPESGILNPAFSPPYNFYVNLPIISTFYIGFESPFSFDQLTQKWETGDSLYIDRETVLNALKDNNYFSFEIYNELGRVGFRAGRNYFHLSIAKVFSTKFSFEKDIIELFLYGNGSEQFLGKPIHFDKTGLNMTSYHEFALGYSIRINEKLTVGTHLKYLNGCFNIWTEKAEFRMFTDDQSTYAITASSDINIHTSSTISNFDNLIYQVENYKWFDLTGNHGFGCDIGVEYEPRSMFKLSASVVDIGWIKWKENIKNFKSANPNVDYTFEGFDINDFVSEGSFTDTLDILDTITECFGLEKNYEPYTSHLNPKVYLGGLWNLNKSNQLGLLIRTDFVERTIKPSFTVNYTHKFGDVLSVYANYSILNRNYANIGLGFAVKLGPVQFYALNDMAYALLKPREARNYNFHFGMSFVFGTPKEFGKSLKIDSGEGGKNDGE